MGALPSMPRVANDCLSQVERGALEEQLRCDNCVLVKTEGWGQVRLRPQIRKENGVECTKVRSALSTRCLRARPWCHLPSPR